MFKHPNTYTKRMKRSQTVILQISLPLNIVFFLSNGKAGYVLSKYQDKVYKEIEQGDHFGHIDLANTKIFMKTNKKKVHKKKQQFKSFFQVKAMEHCDLMTLSIKELEKMKFEFSDVYFELVDDANKQLQENLQKMDEEVERIEIEKAKKKSELKSNISNLFLSRLHKNMLKDEK
jgi:CRP-like cAMP-binding protein